MFAIVDIEATGGSPKVARIMEIAVVVHNGERVIEEFATLVNPEQRIDPFVVALTGISNEMVEDQPKFVDISEKIFELTKNRILVAHNVRFDYGFLKNEFSRLGIRFQRQNLCTVKMSRKLMPGMSSYSLGKLCKDLDIPIKNRHRALGDAAATTVLLERLLFNDKKQLVQDLLKHELNEAILPSNISKKMVDALPEETGVYIFYNEKEQPIYIGKSKNIRQRILRHFGNDVQSSRALQMKQEIHDIDYILTGSELIAELYEAGEIKRWMPKFNRAQRRKKYRYAVYYEPDQAGFYRLKMGLINPQIDPILKFTTKRWAEKAVNELNHENGLNQENRLRLGPEQYNQLVLQSLDRYFFEEPNVFIVGPGRNYFEQSVIQIENGHYVGYGFFNYEEVQIDSPKELLAFINKDYNSPDKEQIIRKHLRKKHRLKLITYSYDKIDHS